MTMLTLENLSHSYGSTRAVQDISLEVASGEMVTLLGPSGCGKTTTMKMVAGLLAPAAGDVLFDGVSVLNTPAERRQAVMVFQAHLLFPYLTVRDNVGFGLRMRGLPKREIAAQAEAMLERVHLTGMGDRKPSDLSGGQQQRVALARALVLDPKVLLLDEPLSSLDPHLRGEMRDLIRGIQRATGITTLVVTHDQDEAAALGDRMALMQDGRLLQYARPEAFYAQPASRAVAEFFGGTNFIPGQSSDGVFDCALGQLTLPGPDGPGTLTIRPEAIRLDGGGELVRGATVGQVTHEGAMRRVTVRVGETPLEAVVRPAEAAGLGQGAKVQIGINRADLWVLPQKC